MTDRCLMLILTVPNAAPLSLNFLLNHQATSRCTAPTACALNAKPEAAAATEAASIADQDKCTMSMKNVPAAALRLRGSRLFRPATNHCTVLTA